MAAAEAVACVIPALWSGPVLVAAEEWVETIVGHGLLYCRFVVMAIRLLMNASGNVVVIVMRSFEESVVAAGAVLFLAISVYFAAALVDD